MRGHRGRRIWEMPKKIKQSQLVGREGGVRWAGGGMDAPKRIKRPGSVGRGVGGRKGALYSKGILRSPRKKTLFRGGRRYFKNLLLFLLTESCIFYFYFFYFRRFFTAEVFP